MSTSVSGSSPAACRLLKADETFTGKQELQHAGGISAESVGSRGIHMQLVTIPPEEERTLTNTPRTRQQFTPSPANPASGTANIWSITPSSNLETFSRSPLTFPPPLQSEHNGDNHRRHRPNRPKRAGGCRFDAGVGEHSPEMKARG